MKTVALLALVLSLSVFSAVATADEVYVPAQSPGTGVNFFPFQVFNSDWRYQLVIQANDLGNQAFTITDLAFSPSTGGGHVSSLFEVRMSHTTVPASSTFAVNLPNPTTLLSSTNFTWTCTASTWCPLGLTGTFNYDGVSGLTIEVRYQGGRMTGAFQGGCFNVGRTGAPHDRVGQSGSGAFTATTGTLWPKSGLSIRLTVVRALITPSGSGQVGTTITFNLSAPSDASRAYQVGSSLGQGPIRIGPHSLPLGVDELLKLSVGGLVPLIFRNYTGVLDAKGAAVAKVAIPNIGALKGVRFYTAFLTLDAAKPMGIGIVSAQNVLITIS